MMMSGFVTNVSMTLNFYVFEFYFWSLLFSIALLPIDFIFRYLSVCRNKELSNRQLFLMVFFAYFITWLHAFPNATMFIIKGPAPDSIEFTQELQNFPDWKNHVPSYSVTALGSTKSAFNSIFIICLNSFSYGIIIFTYSKINRALKTNAQKANNPKTVEIQKQVSKILILQSALPFFVICIPVSITCVFALAYVDLPHFGPYMSFIYYWLATVKPTATIIIIPRYRKYMKMKLMGMCQEIGTTEEVVEETKEQNVDYLNGLRRFLRE